MDGSAALADDRKLPADYFDVLEGLKRQVHASALRASRVASTELLALSWLVGHAILDRQEHAGWGCGVVDRLAADLRAAFPHQRGWSRTEPSLHAGLGWGLARP